MKFRARVKVKATELGDFILLENGNDLSFARLQSLVFLLKKKNSSLCGFPVRNPNPNFDNGRTKSMSRSRKIDHRKSRIGS